MNLSSLAALAAAVSTLAVPSFGHPTGRHPDAERMLADSHVRHGFVDLDAPVFDSPGDGAIWIHGRTYKARIDARGFTYIPFFGSQAPHDFPVSFALRSAAIGAEELPLHFDLEPIRDDARVYVDHGSIVEIYDFSLDSVEQSFQVRRGTREGDLDLRLGVESEMPRGTDAEESWFQAPMGSVRYERARSTDHAGSPLVTRTVPVENGFEFSISASELARTSGDILIDPFIATVFVDVGAADDKDPDIAYDVTRDRYLIAYQETYSQTDHDVRGQMIDGATGQPIPNTGVYIDYTTDDWQQVSVGNLRSASQFLVAASVGPTPRQIRCRTLDAGSEVMGNPFTLTNNISPVGCSFLAYTQFLAPVVGGDSTPSGTSGPRYYCVVWITEGVWDDITYPCPEAWYCNVQSNGYFTTPRRLDAFLSPANAIARTDDGTYWSLSISKSNGDWESGSDQNWNVAYRADYRFINGQTVSGESRVTVARITANGAVSLNPTRLVAFTNPLPGTDYVSTVYSAVSASTSQPNYTRKFMVTFDASKWDLTVAPHIWGAIVDPTTIVNGSVTPTLYDLTNLQSVANGGLNFTEWHPSVECDGTSYVLAFETVGGGLTGLGASEFGYVNYFGHPLFQCIERPVQAFLNPFAIGAPRCCAETSGDGTRHYTLMASTRWTGSPPQADPIAALHSD